MDFEMDIPDADELQWLESNSFPPEDEDEYIIEEEGEAIAEELPANPNDQSDLRKRARSDLPEEKGGPETSGRIKRRELLPAEDDDEEWLRRSPAKGPADDVLPEADAPVLAPPEVEEEEEEEEKENIISRFAIEIEGECMPVTGPGGDRVYAKLDSREEVSGAAKPKQKFVRDKSLNGLLSAPISELINEMEQEILQKTLKESFGSPSHAGHPASPIVTEQLWVDKYSPNSFTELLSDEQTNREVLLWLKQWDSCVFGSHIRSTTEDVLSALRRYSSAQHQKHSDKRGFFSKNLGASFSNQRHPLPNVAEKENDNLNSIPELRSKKLTVNCAPEQKVLLLCGPPGLGKTTLAHVAAKHCGYRVVEINASDERSTSTVESKILDVVQMDSVMSDSKPKCLVIDEIDGALGEGKGAVEVILKMLAAEKQSSVEKGATQQAQTGKASSRKGQRAVKLLRPVICICNDLYAPALRSLRQVAKVHTFVQPTTSRVVNRLKYICKKEGFKTNSISLSALAEYTECDIRSCLNTLQFLYKKNETLNFLDVGSQVVGRKDMSRSIFDIWKEVFQKRKSKRERKSETDSSGHKNFDFLYSLFSNRGDYELTMDGIHENFLRLSYHDPMMQKTVKCLDALGISDSLLQYMWRTQHMSLNVYQPSIAITMRNMISQFEKPNIEWPKSLQRCRVMLMERKDSLKIWHNKISPSISRHLSSEYFVEDLISPLLHILSPPALRPVALHLLSEREKNDLAQLVDTMVSYSITYKHLKPEPLQNVNKFLAVSDAPELSLDPPIDNFVKFKDYQSEYVGLSLAMKQILVHEVEKQRIMRESTGRANDKVMPSINSTTATAAGSSQLKVAPNKRQSLASTTTNSSEISKSFPPTGKPSKTPEVKRSVRTSSSFFDSFRKGSDKESRGPGEIVPKAATIERDSRPLLFKYNEGFTNAVKRPVKIRELLL
ncbi:chromosome transmission fidelity protein 18-like protein [Iris pallida]|uniref:Chromosome transmission fidelity protein 18 homolog n=1 Tax=Iris pallida TaxID=29817 RepID=A0AAX6HDP8_IRIPA|nr:chromosome transmission fidelity protein 18-like protein [Iris pallida]